MNSSLRVLEQLTKTAPEADLRAALLAVCKTLDRSNDAIQILADRRRCRAQQEEEPENTQKRKALPVCAGCDREFSEAGNGEGSCEIFRFHPEAPEKYYDDDFWADNDSEFGDEFEEYEEGYIFPCCKQLGTADGCRPYIHIAKIDSTETVRTKSQRTEP